MIYARPYRVVAPAALPVTLAEAKDHLRVTHDDNDAAINRAIAAATDMLDGYEGVLGRALITQTWAIDAGCGLPRQLEPGPVQSIGRVAVLAIDGTVVTDVTADYAIDPLGWMGMLSGRGWPVLPSRDHRIEARFVCGYGDGPDDVPARVRSAILLIVGDLYEHRESVAVGVAATPIPTSATVDRLLASLRSWRV